jgi:phosphoglycolate phosphatase-like HAD superfamily hydrolase
VIFDFDATLFLLKLPWEEYLAETHRLVRDHDEVAYDALVNEHQHADKIVNAFVKAHGPAVLEKTLPYSRKFETERLTGVLKNEVLLGTVRTLLGDSRYDIFIWTSNCRATVEPILQRHGMLSQLKRVVTKDDVTLTKPEPNGFALMSEYYQHSGQPVPALDTWLMVGDSSADKGAAAAAGIDFFVVEDVAWSRE